MLALGDSSYDAALCILFMLATNIFLFQALREELAAAERRAEDERTAHNATKMVHNKILIFYFSCFVIGSLGVGIEVSSI